MLWSDLVVVIVSCTGAAALALLTGVVVRRIGRRRALLRTVDRHARIPWVATLATAAALLTTPRPEDGASGYAALRHALAILLIAALTWLAIAVVRIVEDASLVRLRIDVADNRRVRKLRTQVTVTRRVLVTVLVVIGVAAALMTFASMRAFGASLLASAGLAGIVGGIAAQSVLGNVFAGLQLAFNDALRVDDVIVVDDEWGRVEELTLTYVVLHLWDERRLVLPTTYFTQQPFQNWTRTSSRNLGAVYLYLDFTAPIDALRTEAERVVRESPLWDRQAWTLQVTGATERAIEVRVLASAKDAGTAFDLRCEVRERLLAWMRDNHPRSLPTTRLAATGAGLDDARAGRRLTRA